MTPRNDPPLDRDAMALRLKIVRGVLGMTTEQLAETLNVRAGTIRAYEAGQNPMPLHFLVKLEQVHGVPQEYISLGVRTRLQLYMAEEILKRA